MHTGDENDSPRGRIYLMRATEEGRLSVESNSFRKHINRCLGCRACEQACPAGVEYGQLLEAARSDLSKVPAQQRGMTSGLFRFVLRRVWLHPARLRFAFALARIIRYTRLPGLLVKIKLARLISPRFEFALGLLDSSRPADFRAPVEAGINSVRALSSSSGQGQELPLQKSSTRLFTGCVTEGLFSRVNRATTRVLEANNCAVSVPREQVCCGALHAHAGDLEGARQLARRNLDAFAGDEASIVTTAGGCGAMLLSYNHLLADDPKYSERAQEFSSRVRDISQQLAETGIREGANIGDVVVTYDASCHLLYGQRARETPVAILRAIPQLRLVPLEGSDVCCGGAGVYNLLEPEMSARVLDEKLLHIKETGATLLATGNPGCHMQIGAGAQLSEMRNLRLCHPIELLDESYARAGLYKEVMSDK